MSEPEPFASTDLHRVRRNPWIMGLAASPLLLTIAAFVSGLAINPVLLGATLHPTVLALVLTVFAYRRNPRPVVEQVPIRADRTEIQVGDLHVPRAEIRGGFVLPPRKGQLAKVVLRRRRRLPIEIAVRRREEGRQLLRAMGLDVSQTVAEFRALSRVMARGKHIAGAVAGVFGAWVAFVAGVLGSRGGSPVTTAFAGGLFVIVLVMMLALLVTPTRLSVGADGIAMTWLGRTRFVGYDEIAGVLRYEQSWGNRRRIGVTLKLRSGEDVLVPIGQSKLDDDTVAIVAERIREAIDAYRRGGTAEDSALLRRGHREVSAWVTALRAIGSGANADMRSAPVPRERLFRIVEDPTSPPTDRAAAAVALGAEPSDDERMRLRAAAEATAVPRLRFAIEAASEGSDEAALREALDALETEEREPRRA